MSHGGDDQRPGLIFRTDRHPRMRAWTHSLLIVLAMTVIGVIAAGFEEVAHPHESAQATGKPAPAVVARARTFDPFWLVRLYAQALPAPKPDPSLTVGFSQLSPEMRRRITGRSAPDQSPAAPIAGDAASAPTPPENVPLQHWASREWTWATIPVALADVVWSLASYGPLGARFFTVCEFLLGAAVALWVWTVGLALLAQATGRPTLARWPQDQAGRFLVRTLLWPLGTLLFASLMAVAAEGAAGVVGPLLGPLAAAIASGMAPPCLGCIFLVSLVEVRLHGLLGAAINAL